MIPGHINAVRWIATAAGLAVLVVACGGSGPSASPSAPSPSAVASGPPPSTAPSGGSSPAASVPPVVTPSTSPGATPSAAAVCAIEPQTGRLPSDRLVDVVISQGEVADLVTFVFGDASLPTPPQGFSNGSLDVATPPFAEGGSGLPIKVDGDRVVSVRFTGMSLSNDLGQPTYEGKTDFRPDLATLRAVVNVDRFEGVMSWLIGYDGGGCVVLSSDRKSVTVSIAHPAS